MGRPRQGGLIPTRSPYRWVGLLSLAVCLLPVALPCPVMGATSIDQATRPVSGGRPWIMVDDDGRAAPDDCESHRATFRTIQGALDAARAGDRISVCPGRYRESLYVGPGMDDVYLATELSFQAVLTPPSTEGRPAVDIGGVTRFEMRGFRIRPSGRMGPVTLGGLHIPGTRVCSPAPIAIRIRDSSDVTIRGNKIASPPACGYRVGIEVTRSTAMMSGDQVTDFLGHGIVARGGSDVGIDHTDVRFLHTGRARALPGDTFDPEASGIVLDGVAGARLRTVSVFTRVPTGADELPSLLWAGIAITDATGPVSIRGDSVVTRTWRYGIRVVGSDQVSILNTLVRRTYGDGIFLDGLSGAKIIGTDTDRSVTGIRLGPDTSAVTVDHLRATHSAVIDCVDESTGTGTGGTANTWRHASGHSSEPAGSVRRPDDLGQGGRDPSRQGAPGCDDGAGVHRTRTSRTRHP